MMLLLWVVIGFMILYFIKNNNEHNSKYDFPKTPDTILKQRYVNGEIDEATYERMRQTISR